MFVRALMLAAAVPGIIAGQSNLPAKLPEGAGRDALQRVCGNCHQAAVVVGRHGNAQTWKKTVDTMVSRGARGTREELDQIAAYLAAHFGPAPVTLPDGPGKSAVEKVCLSCHLADVFAGHEGTLSHWKTTVDKMVARGAVATNEEFEAIEAYLARHFGFIPVPSNLPAGAAKSVLERACGSCHGVDVFFGRTGDEQTWARATANMVRFGAEVTDAEFDQIVEYLVANFGPVPEKIPVNAAGLNELISGLGLNVEEAEAILTYRKGSPLKDWDDFGRVPGLDVKKVAARKDRVLF